MRQVRCKAAFQSASELDSGRSRPPGQRPTAASVLQLVAGRNQVLLGGEQRTLRHLGSRLYLEEGIEQCGHMSAAAAAEHQRQQRSWHYTAVAQDAGCATAAHSNAAALAILSRAAQQPQVHRLAGVPPPPHACWQDTPFTILHTIPHQFGQNKAAK